MGQFPHGQGDMQGKAGKEEHRQIHQREQTQLPQGKTQIQFLSQGVGLLFPSATGSTSLLVTLPFPLLHTPPLLRCG